VLLLSKVGESFKCKIFFFLFNNPKVHGCLISNVNLCERILKIMLSFVQVSKP
jgi:hypothetical protein